MQHIKSTEYAYTSGLHSEIGFISATAENALHVKLTTLAISTYKSSINIICRFEAIRLHDLIKQTRLLMLPALANHHQQLGVCFGSWLVPVLLTKKFKNPKASNQNHITKSRKKQKKKKKSLTRRKGSRKRKPTNLKS